jgi:hypothetical protein
MTSGAPIYSDVTISYDVIKTNRVFECIGEMECACISELFVILCIISR